MSWSAKARAASAVARKMKAAGRQGRKIPKDMMKWKKRVNPKRIMTTEQFNSIASEKGKRVAGAIYWGKVKSEYKKAMIRRAVRKSRG